MATSIYKINEQCWNLFTDEIADLSFDNNFSPKESKYMVKAVGQILLEIQKILENSRVKSFNSCPTRVEKRKTTSNLGKRLKYKSQQALSEEEISEPVNEINHWADQTYHRRELDQVISKTKKPVDRTVGSLNWKDLPSSKLPVPSQSFFHCPSLLHRPSIDEDINGASLKEDVYSINRVNVKITSFVSSFYKHYSIVSYSSFILSLIYIDRFLKSQQIKDFREFSKFSITR